MGRGRRVNRAPLTHSRAVNPSMLVRHQTRISRPKPGRACGGGSLQRVTAISDGRKLWLRSG